MTNAKQSGAGLVEPSLIAARYDDRIAALQELASKLLANTTGAAGNENSSLSELHGDASGLAFDFAAHM